MALQNNSIGRFDFIALHGRLQPPREHLEITQRAAVDGTQITKFGKKGVPFQMVSRVDATTYQSARQLARFYLLLINSNPQTLVQAGISSDAEGYRVQVLSVEPLRIAQIRGASGGRHFPSLGWIEATWTLIAIEN